MLSCGAAVIGDISQMPIAIDNILGFFRCLLVKCELQSTGPTVVMEERIWGEGNLKMRLPVSEYAALREFKFKMVREVSLIIFKTFQLHFWTHVRYLLSSSRK